MRHTAIAQDDGLVGCQDRLPKHTGFVFKVFPLVICESDACMSRTVVIPRMLRCTYDIIIGHIQHRGVLVVVRVIVGYVDIMSKSLMVDLFGGTNE